MLLIQSVSKISRWEKLRLRYCGSSRFLEGGARVVGWQRYISQADAHVLLVILFERLKICMKSIISIKPLW